jgi:hypothetical protein
VPVDAAGRFLSTASTRAPPVVGVIALPRLRSRGGGARRDRGARSRRCRRPPLFSCADGRCGAGIEDPRFGSDRPGATDARPASRRMQGVCSGVRKPGFACVAQMFWPAVLFWSAWPFMASWPLTPAWRAALAGPGSPAAPWAAVALRAPCGSRGSLAPGPGLARRVPLRGRRARDRRARRGVSRARSAPVKSDRPDPAGHCTSCALPAVRRSPEGQSADR